MKITTITSNLHHRSIKQQVVIKTLQLLHRLIIDGHFRFFREFVENYDSIVMSLCSQHYNDRSSMGITHKPLIAQYGRYIKARTNLYRRTNLRQLKGVDDPHVMLNMVRRSRFQNNSHSSSYFDQDNEFDFGNQDFLQIGLEHVQDLFDLMSALQSILKEILRFHFTERQLAQKATVGAFRLILEDAKCLTLMQLEIAYTLVQLIDRMDAKDAESTARLIEDHSTQMNKMIGFFTTAAEYNLLDREFLREIRRSQRKILKIQEPEEEEEEASIQRRGEPDISHEQVSSGPTEDLLLDIPSSTDINESQAVHETDVHNNSRLYQGQGTSYFPDQTQSIMHSIPFQPRNPEFHQHEQQSSGTALPRGNPISDSTNNSNIHDNNPFNSSAILPNQHILDFHNQVQSAFDTLSDEVAMKVLSAALRRRALEHLERDLAWIREESSHSTTSDILYRQQRFNMEIMPIVQMMNALRELVYLVQNTHQQMSRERNLRENSELQQVIHDVISWIKTCHQNGAIVPERDIEQRRKYLQSVVDGASDASAMKQSLQQYADEVKRVLKSSRILQKEMTFDERSAVEDLSNELLNWVHSNPHASKEQLQMARDKFAMNLSVVKSFDFHVSDRDYVGYQFDTLRWGDLSKRVTDQSEVYSMQSYLGIAERNSRK